MVELLLLFYILLASLIFSLLWANSTYSIFFVKLCLNVLINSVIIISLINHQ